MIVKAMNVVAWLFLILWLAIAFIPPVYFFVNKPSTMTAGIGIVWIFLALFTKPASNYQKW